MKQRSALASYKLGLSVLLIIAVFFVLPLRAQVTIGDTKAPEEFSLLEMISANRGLRLPQMTIAQRDIMVATSDFQNEKTDKAMGLQIFDTTTNCVETWNGTEWIEQCGEDGPTMPISSPVPVGYVPYVGAFWKSNQTGERLIRIQRPTSGDADGAWTATVLNYNNGSDWIRLDTNPSGDPNVNWSGTNENLIVNGNDPAFESNQAFHVPGTVTSVTGNMDADNLIYFRIGLTGTIEPNAHRYGVIALFYKDNSLIQYIYIRQGEGADYVMRNSDPVNSGGLTARTQCVKFSPYNLTAAELGVQVGINGTGSNPGIFTQYPTQAGAMFQWASISLPRFAYDPYIPGFPSGISTWSNPDWLSGFWDTLGASNETCPQGFRRPTDGLINADDPNPTVSFSEMRQSLYLNPPSEIISCYDNFVWGYYADGFFDRRQIVNSPTGATSSSVSVSNPSIAHIGGLFYNPATQASLFFPAAGLRDFPDGLLRYVGSNGWVPSGTSISVPTLQQWGMTYNGGVSPMSYNRNYGTSIRCVKN